MTSHAFAGNDRPYHKLVERTRQALVEADWPRVHAVQASMPEVVTDALAGLTPAQLQEVAVHAA